MLREPRTPSSPVYDCCARDAHGQRLPARENIEGFLTTAPCVQGVLSFTAYFCVCFSLLGATLSRLLERNGWFADVDPESRAGDLLDYTLPRGHELRAVRPEPSARRTGDTGPPRRPPTARPPLRFLKGDSPAGKMEDPSRKTRGHPAAQCDMIKLPEHKKRKPAPPRMTPVPLTLEQAIQTHHVVEARTTRRYWTNYVDQE